MLLELVGFAVGIDEETPLDSPQSPAWALEADRLYSISRPAIFLSGRNQFGLHPTNRYRVALLRSIE